MSYKEKLESLEEKLDFFLWEEGPLFPQLFIIYGNTNNKEIELQKALSKIDREIVDIRETINSEEKLFRILNENNGKAILLRYVWAPTILENEATQLLRDIIGWTPDGVKWDAVEFNSQKLNFNGKIIIESNESELDSDEIKQSDILRDSEVFKFSLDENELKERNSE